MFSRQTRALDAGFVLIGRVDAPKSNRGAISSRTAT